MNVLKHEFDGNKAVTLKNDAGLCVTLCALGAGIVSIKAPDRDGVAREVTRLPESGYATAHHGLTVGRTAGRIENATFTIDGKTAVLEKNNHGVDNLHGGATGLHKKVFDMTVVENKDDTVVTFACKSPDGEGGYFGNVDVVITYKLLNAVNELSVTFEATPDCKTLMNMTNHVYFDMSGDLREPVTEQTMFLNASRVGVLNERLIVQKIAEVPTEFDFRKPHKVGDYINAECVQRFTHGYDHPFFLDGRGLDKIACSLYSALSGIKLEVSTTYPCAVVYGDNFGGYKSICFECQYHPDGIHACPDDCGICTPEKPYKEIMSYRFSIE